MPTFIDESGNTGPISGGGSAHFRLAAVWMAEMEEVIRFQEAVRRLRRELALPETFEFKYAKTHRKPDLRKAFFDSALAFDFQFAVSTIDKRESYWARAGRNVQHWACVTELTATLRSVYYRTEQQQSLPYKELVIVDDNGDGDFLATVKRQSRGLGSRLRPGSSMIGKVMFRASHQDAMLQLADMVCGSFAGMDDSRERTTFDQIAGRRIE